MLLPMEGAGFIRQYLSIQNLVTLVMTSYYYRIEEYISTNLAFGALTSSDNPIHLHHNQSL